MSIAFINTRKHVWHFCDYCASVHCADHHSQRVQRLGRAALHPGIWCIGLSRNSIGLVFVQKTKTGNDVAPAQLVRAVVQQLPVCH